MSIAEGRDPASLVGDGSDAVRAGELLGCCQLGLVQLGHAQCCSPMLARVWSADVRCFPNLQSTNGCRVTQHG